jgi:TolB-like protein/DNA-binding winged helix-turn-helix (wHTH) protein
VTLSSTRRKHRRLSIGDLVVDEGRRKVSRGAEVVPLPGLSFDLLMALAGAAPNLLTVEELMDKVWRGRVVGPETVTQRVKLLRRSLGEDSQQPRYIVSVRGQGYRLVAQVASLGNAEDQRRPLSIRRLATGGSVVAFAGLVLVALLLPYKPADAPSKHGSSIAVLPFEYRGSANDGELGSVLTDGLYDDLLTRLAQVNGLRVISRTTAERYRDSRKQLSDIGRELGVASVLEGGLQQVEQRIRINVQLIDAQNDTHIWAETFDRNLTAGSLFTVQSELARTVASMLSANIPNDGGPRREPTQSLGAYSLYVQGRQALYERSPASAARARQFFAEAVEIDEHFAPAYAGAAIATLYLSAFGALPDYEAMIQAEPLAQRAIELDPDLAEGHAALGLVLWQCADSAGAEAALRHAARLSPGSANIRIWLGQALMTRSNTREAHDQHLAAVASDPLSAVVNNNLIFSYAALGSYEDALRHGELFQQQHAESALVHWALALTAEEFGRFADSLRYALSAKDVGQPIGVLPLVGVLTSLGRYGLAEDWLSQATPLGANLYFQITRDDFFWRSGQWADGDRHAQTQLQMMSVSDHTVQHSASLRYALWSAGFWKLALDDAAAALVLFERIPFAPDSHSLIPNGFGFELIDLGRAYLATNQPEAGRATLQRAAGLMNRAIEGGHRSPSIFFELGVTHALLGEVEQALSRIRQSVDAGWRRPSANRAMVLPPSITADRGFQDLMAMVDEDIAAMRREAAAELVVRRAPVQFRSDASFGR